MGRESIYWFIVFLTFLYILRKNYKSQLKVLIILCFYTGLASFLGKSIENPYKILLVIFSFYLLLKKNGLSHLSKKEHILLFVFFLFSISFFCSALINNDYFNLTFSQFGKYITPICLFYVLHRILIKSPDAFSTLNSLFFSLLSIQIILSFVKIITIGFKESTVGSIAYDGGGPAAILPILGFILLWLDKKGNFTRKDWIYTLLLFLIGIVSFKRAILFIMPVFIFLFMYYVPRRLKAKHLLYGLPLLPLIFYIGVRLNPTLNKESKIGGSFDFHYVLDYAQKYSFGKTSQSSGVQLGQGRGGATLLLISKLFNDQSLSSKDMWGIGLKGVYTTDYEEFEKNNYEVNSKGSITGVFQSYLTAGFVGVMVTILLIISIAGLILEPRIRIVVALLLFWDYLFYSGLILRTQSLFVLLFFIIIYSNLQYEQKLYRKFSIIKSNDKNRNLQVRPA
jgi:hypothetical protein